MKETSIWKLRCVVTAGCILLVILSGCGFEYDKNDSTSIPLGVNWSIKDERVWRFTPGGSTPYTPTRESLEIWSNTGGTGSIKDGLLSFVPKIPPDDLRPIGELFMDFPIIASNANARFSRLELQTALGPLNKEIVHYSMVVNGVFMTAMSDVSYVYVTEDVNVRSGASYQEGITFREFNMNLVTGWNAVFMQRSLNAPLNSANAANVTGTVSISAQNNPNVRWTLGGGPFGNLSGSTVP